MSFKSPLAFGPYLRRLSLHYNSFQGNVGGSIEFVRQFTGKKAKTMYEDLAVSHTITSADVPPSLKIEWKDGLVTEVNPENMRLADVVELVRNDLGRYRLKEWREELGKPVECVGE